MLTEPQVHSKSFKGPDAETMSQEFVESFQSMDPTENIYEYEKIDDDGNVVRVTQQVVVRPEVHTVTFSGSDAHKQMEEYMQQWKASQQSADEFEAGKTTRVFTSEGYHQQLVSCSSDQPQDFIISTESSPQLTSDEVIHMGSETTTVTRIVSSSMKDVSPEKTMMFSTTSVSGPSIHQTIEREESCHDKAKE